jgi:hypothetical protein
MTGQRHDWHLQMTALVILLVFFDAVVAFSSAPGGLTTKPTSVAGNKLSLLTNKYSVSTTTTTTTPRTSRFHSRSCRDKRPSSSPLSRKSSSSSTALCMISRQSMEQLGVFLGIMTILQRRALWKMICHQFAYLQTLSRQYQVLVVVASCAAVYAAIVKPFWNWYQESSSSSSSLQDEDDGR